MRRRAQSGSAALEFAFIAPVLFVLLMGIIEDGVLYFAGATLQNAVDDVARVVRTGQAQTSNPAMTQAQFRTSVCNEVSPLIQCNANLQIDVQSYSSGYGTASFASPLNASGNLNGALNNWSPGNPCDVVLVRVFYKWRVVTPILSQFLSNMAGGYHLVSATSAFRNEPFTSAVNGC